MHDNQDKTRRCTEAESHGDAIPRAGPRFVRADGRQGRLGAGNGGGALRCALSPPVERRQPRGELSLAIAATGFLEASGRHSPAAEASGRHSPATVSKLEDLKQQAMVAKAEAYLAAEQKLAAREAAEALAEHDKQLAEAKLAARKAAAAEASSASAKALDEAAADTAAARKAAAAGHEGAVAEAERELEEKKAGAPERERALESAASVAHG